MDWGDIIWDRGDNFSTFIDRGSHRGISYRDTWTGCTEIHIFFKTDTFLCQVLFLTVIPNFCLI